MDATTCPDDALFAAAEQFVPAAELSRDAREVFRKAVGGVNNRVYHCRTLTGRAIVLRVYNNGGSTARVRYEHSVLEALASKSATLPFALPRLLRALGTGATWAAVPSMEPGTEACAFELIAGAVPAVASLKFARSAGEATALLVGAMAATAFAPLPCPNPLFRDVYRACPGTTVTPGQLRAAMAGEAFAAHTADVQFLLSELDRVVAVANALDLPAQQIHADAHLDNFLAVDETVSGLLDFEFSSVDWRVMELCVGLTKYVASDGVDVRALVAAYLHGYATHARLTDAEQRFVSDGMVLRILSNVVFFCGRAALGQDRIEMLASKVGPYARRCRWIEANRDWLLQQLADAFSASK